MLTTMRPDGPIPTCCRVTGKSNAGSQYPIRPPSRVVRLGSAHAADWLAPQADYGFAARCSNWTGGYIGAHGGWNWSNYSASVDGISLGSVDTDGAVVGLQAGYGVQGATATISAF